ncbi:vWA domain-containing protein [uncultured Thiocystis sp.]|uniref:vWA domain-containing protein n=1 Tax=uncultured Thiocystis sp. TaxID=1202134 RepID=UPI0025CC0179|nr:vWA domain-containing protein [uncultured Thiocystis sp.]
MRKTPALPHAAVTLDMMHHPTPPRIPGRLLAALLLALLTTAGTLVAATPEVRILIDVSGSMKRNDPQNLRIPALRLVNELLPEGARAGVWLFAEKTEILAPPGPVDDQWKTRTRARLEHIHSRGLFTDIEQAITAAVAGWETPTADSERHLVLLTDGLVDVSKDADQSAASRARIVSTQIEQLKTLNVKVHAIALSDEVDAELLRLLTTQTDGWLESPKDADALQRVFLRMLEQTAAPTTVPLEGNRFEIDARVSEFTLLAFRGAEGATQLISPAGDLISANKPSAGVTWRKESGYDLVTLAQPKPGQWELQGATDPDNRVVVVTDLGIELAPLPNTLRHGETLRLEVWLTDHQQPVTRSDFLRLLTASATLTPISESPRPGDDGGAQTPSRHGEEPPPEQVPEPQDSANGVEVTLVLDQESGRYRSQFETKSLVPGLYQLNVVLDGGTFKRQTSKRLHLAGPPFTIAYQEQLPSDASPVAALMATLTIEPDLIDPSTVSGYLLLQDPEGRKTVVDVPKPTIFPLALSLPVERPGEFQLHGRLLARTLTGEAIDFDLEPRPFVFEFAAPAGANRHDKTSDSSEGLSWIEFSLYLLVGNAILGLMLGLTWWLLRRSTKSAAIDPARQARVNSA